MRIIGIVGARPNFMKIAPIARAFSATEHEFCLVHTGQHYDEKMSDSFFRELEIPEPDINLEVGSASHAVQMAEIMKRFEPVCHEFKPDWVLVVGDVNSTAACSLVATKLGIKVCHVEAGLRSRDRAMPEEINRLVTDAISDLLLTTCEEGDRNLLAEGHPRERVKMVGNPMIDTLSYMLNKAGDRNLPARFYMDPGSFGVVTLHRPSNVDNPELLKNLLGTMDIIQQQLPLVFAIHPRTRKMAEQFGLLRYLESMPNIKLSEPLSYLDFLNLYSQSKLVLTDSGGIQEETSWLDIPCITLRENTERYITVDHGTNYLIGTNRERILQVFETVMKGRAKRRGELPMWDGHAAERIVEAIFE